MSEKAGLKEKILDIVCGTNGVPMNVEQIQDALSRRGVDVTKQELEVVIPEMIEERLLSNANSPSYKPSE